MKQKLVIDGRLPGLNEMTKSNRTNKYAGNEEKQLYTNLVAQYCKIQKLMPFEKKIDVEFMWYCKDKRRDKDNIMAGQKFIFDGLTVAGIIKNDGWGEIGKIAHDFEIDKENERIEVMMIERI